jgi:hypothetical protein
MHLLLSEMENNEEGIATVFDESLCSVYDSFNASYKMLLLTEDCVFFGRNIIPTFNDTV